MPYMRNVSTGAIIGPMASDSAEYLYLASLRSGNQPVYEDVGTQEAATVAAAQSETFQRILPGVAIAADLLEVVYRPTYAGKITKAEYIPTAAVTGAASPASRTLNVLNGGQAGAGSTNMASLPLVSGTNLTANASNIIPLSGTPANLVFAANDEIEWQSLHVGGTGLVDPGGLVIITVSRD